VIRVQERHLLLRSIAYTIDASISCAILGMPCVAILVGMIISPDPGELSAPAAVMIGCSFLVAVPLGFGYFLMRDGLRKGSPGKRICGLRVVDARTGEPCRPLQSVVRNLLLLVIGAFDLLVPFFRKDGRRLGDTVAGTVVVRGS
jgi:uncharacterized RDD family membrane protein YckC